MNHHHQEPRSQFIVRLTLTAIRNGGLTVNAFATRVAEAYVARVALHERTMEFHAGETLESAARAEKANGQLISRIINGIVKFPCDLEEAWIAALPDTARDAAVQALAERYGLLGARAPAAPDDIHGQMSRFAALSREFGEAVEALAPIFADGKCDAGDRPNVQHALRELTELTAAITTLQEQLRRAVPTNVAKLPRQV